MKGATPIFAAYLAIAGGMALLLGVFDGARTLLIAGMALLCAAAGLLL